MTLHSAFDLNFNGRVHESLSDKKLAQFRTNLADLKLIIVDEMRENVLKAKLCEQFKIVHHNSLGFQCKQAVTGHREGSQA